MSHPNSHLLEYGKIILEYQLSYTARETLAIHVHPDTSVTVEAPLGSDFTEIEKRLRKRAAWIVRQQRNFRRYSFDIPPRQYVSGETHRYLGRQYRLKVIENEGSPELVRMDRGQLFLYIQDKTDTGRKKKLVDAWYRRQAQRVFAERVTAWLPHFERYGIKPPKILVRQMKTRWGSCTKAGKITLNLKLVQAPTECVDYVVVHEMCHLVEHNHSSEYYILLSRVLPDWRERKKKLDGFDFG
jgi:predicted metal-dependent hydrolase